MLNLLITGITFNCQWKIHMTRDTLWEAWIVDPEEEMSGAPLLSDYGFEPLVEQIKVYEAGMQGLERIRPRD